MFDITKTIDLHNNDGLSAIGYNAAQQHHLVYGIFHQILKDIRPLNILEIGTALGGLTKFLDITCDELQIDAKIISYDIHKNNWYEDMNSKKLQIIVKNIFSDNYKYLIDNTVIDFIQNNGTTLVLCDGGNKKNEFNILSKYLKTGDIIMAHDYAPDSEYFYQYMYQTIWNWHEISYEDIEFSINQYNLSPFRYSEMLSVAWGSFRKL